MSTLDPEKLFARLVGDLPPELLEHVFVVGSLAAAYHFRVELAHHGVNTKDADLVIYPAGDTTSCTAMATRLLTAGWTRLDNCFPSESPEPPDELRAIRLYPPDSLEYFVEFLNLPNVDQDAPQRWEPVELEDGWYGLPTFRFQGVCAHERQQSKQGLAYAHPRVMALANLLSHPVIRPEHMSATIGGRRIRRSAKDLGRVLALAHLAGRDEAEAWREPWMAAMRECFPTAWHEHARGTGDGLRELLRDDSALDEALHTCEIGLLHGRGVTLENLRAIGRRLLVDVIEPLEQQAVRDR